MKMLFCTDGSPQAENAVRFGAPIAVAFQAETTVLGIAEKAGEQDDLLQALRRAQEILKEHQLNPELITKVGRPVPEIVKRTKEAAYDLVVIGAARKDQRGPLWMSIRAYRIIEAVEPPVLVVIGQRAPLRQILLCVSGTPQTDKAVEFVGEIARRTNAGVNLFHVVAEPPAIYAQLIAEEENVKRLLGSNSELGRSLRHQRELLEKLTVPTGYRLRHGLLIPELLKELRQTEYDLVVSGSAPARDRLREYVMGRMTREIVNRAQLPVLVVRTGAPRSQRPLGKLVTQLFHRSKDGKPL